MPEEPQATGEAAKPRYRCPSCQSSDGLWEGVEVPGWRSLDEHLEVIDSRGDRDVDWSGAVSDGMIGCSCGWEGTKASLVVLGADDEPLGSVHPEQQTLV